MILSLSHPLIILNDNCRATCERFEDQENLPPIVVTIDRDQQHMMVTVTDRGGGMSPERLARARMFFSTSGYYAALAYTALALAIFLFRTLHLRVEPEVGLSYQETALKLAVKINF